MRPSIRKKLVTVALLTAFHFLLFLTPSAQAYNPTGALTQKTTGSDTTTYAYNGLDKLTEVATPTATASYAYDAQGRRIQRSAGTDTTNYHLSPGGDIADYETDATGALKSSYLQGADGLISQTDYTGQTPATSYFLYNPHGDTSALTDETGTVTASYRYDAFGNAINQASPANGYTGKWQRDKDNITGTIRMGAREYDPSLGRFTSMDPLKGSPADPQQRNRYAYATNNPLTRYDLNGLSVCGPGLRDNIKDAASWTGDAAGEWWNGVQIGIDNPSMLWDATGQFANDFFIEDFKVLFSADASLNERFGAMGFIALNFVPGGKLGKLGKLAKIAKIERAQGKLATVYRAMDEAGKVKYIGITNNFERRSAEQARRGLNIKEIPGLQYLPRSEARAAEQVLIEHHGLGGTLLNQINSISKNNPIYEESIIRGRELLNSASYQGF